jgi:hypothetical protein
MGHSGEQFLEARRLNAPYLDRRPLIQYLVLGLDPVLLVLARLTTTVFVELMGAFSNLVF